MNHYDIRHFVERALNSYQHYWNIQKIDWKWGCIEKETNGGYEIRICVGVGEPTQTLIRVGNEWFKWTPPADGNTFIKLDNGWELYDNELVFGFTG